MKIVVKICLNQIEVFKNLQNTKNFYDSIRLLKIHR